jgi:hypothetical protein
MMDRLPADAWAIEFKTLEPTTETQRHRDFTEKTIFLKGFSVFPLCLCVSVVGFEVKCDCLPMDAAGDGKIAMTL